MFFEPDALAVRERMRAAFTDATARLDCTRASDVTEAWGHSGRTLGAPVATPTPAGHAWLRMLEVPAGKDGGKLWTGTEEAATAIPSEIPRPHLFRSTEWTNQGHAYRAELSTYITTPICSPTPDLTRHLGLPDIWWSQLRQAIDTLIATPPPASRLPVITQDYVHRTIPSYLGDVGSDTTVDRWTLAHGDLHWANLTSPELTILDWEGFGPAPYGFDAAHLHAYTLVVPNVAARVHAAFADILGTPEGRLAQFTVAAVLLQAADRDPVHARLARHVRRHVGHLLGCAP